jgi:hypothetical protein
MTLPAYRIGAAQATMASLESLGLPLPRAEAVDYALYVENGESDLVGQGILIARWNFGELTQAQLAVLEALAGVCYIQTLLMNGTYGNYSALFVLPPRRAPKGNVVRDYTAEFRKLAAV